MPIRAGEFAESIDPDLAARAVLGTVFYGRLMSAERFDPARASDLVAMVLQGQLTPPTLSTEPRAGGVRAPTSPRV